MPVKYEKSADDLKIEQEDLATNRTLKHLKDLNYYKFSIGDLLVREDWRNVTYGGPAQWNLYTAQCGLPYKYVYAFENELGVGYIRRLSITGERFVESPMCVVNFDPSETRFRLDSAYADHILMASEDEEFDLKADYKRVKSKKNAMQRANDKLREKMDTEEDVLALLKRLKVGDKVWYGYRKASVFREHYNVIKVHLDPRYPKDSYVEMTASWHPNSNWANNKYSVSQLQGHSLFTTRPQFLEDLF